MGVLLAELRRRAKGAFGLRRASLYLAQCTHRLEVGVPTDFDGCFDER